MIYEVTYKDRAGNELMKATFHAPTPREALEIMATTPSLQPPEGTHDIDISCGGEDGMD